MSLVVRVPCILFFVLFAHLSLYAQVGKNVTIGTVVDRPNAILVVNPPDRNQGILIPQLTTAERLAMAPRSPEDDGLLLFDFTRKDFFYWKGGQWHALGASQQIDYDSNTNTLSLTDGGSVNLTSLREIPEQTGNGGKVLVTDGNQLSWSSAANGDITGINATNGIEGGGSSGEITLGINTDGNSITIDGANNLAVANSGITTSKIANNAVTTGKIASGGNNKVLSTDATGNVVWTDQSAVSGDDQTLSLTGNTLSIDGGNAVSLNAAGQVTGPIDNLAIADGAVTNVKLANNAVDANKIANNAVTTGKIASGGNNKVLSTDATGNVVWSDQSAVSGDDQTLSLAGNTLSIDGGNSVSLNAAGQVAGPIDNLAITDGAVTNVKLANNAVTTGKIASGGNNKVLSTDATGNVVWTDQSAVSGDDQTLSLAGNTLSIDGGNSVSLNAGGQVTGPIDNLAIADGAVTNVKLANNAVDANKIANNAVTTGKIASGGNNKVLSTDATGNVVWTDQSAVSGDDQTLSLAGNTLSIDGGNAVSLNAAGQVTGPIDNLAIADGAVTNVKLANNAVDANKIANNAVTTGKIASGGNNKVLSTDATGNVVWSDQSAVSGDDQTLSLVGNTLSIDGGNSVSFNAAGQVTGPIDNLAIADGAVTNVKLANNAVDANKIANNAITTGKIASGGNNKVLATDATGNVVWSDQTISADDQTLSLAGNTLSIDGGNSVTLNAAGQVAGPINNLAIADGAVTNTKIANNAVTTGKIASGGNNKVLSTDATGNVVWTDQTISADDQTLSLAGNTLSIDGGNSISLNAAGQVTGPINNLAIADGAVTNAKIANNAVDANKIANNAVTTGKIASGGNNKILSTDASGNVLWKDEVALSVAVQTDNISITGDGSSSNQIRIIPGSINSALIANGSILTDDIQDNTISSTDIGADAVGASELQNNAVDRDAIQNGAVDVTKIAPGTANQILTTNAGGNVEWRDQSLLTPDVSITNELITNFQLTGNTLNLTEAGNNRTVNLNGLSVSGDATGTLNAVTVNRIQGNPVNNAVLGGGDNGKALIWNGTQWTATTVPTLGAQTSFYSVDPGDFQVLKDNGKADKHNLAVFTTNNTFVTAAKQGEGESIMAPLHFTHNSTLTELIIYYYDNAHTNLVVTLYRKNWSTGNNEAMASFTTSGQSATIRTQTLTSFGGTEVISNENYSYRLVVIFDINSDAADPSQAEQRIYGVRLKYQY